MIGALHPEKSQSKLWMAVQQDDVDAIKEFLHDGGDPNTIFDGGRYSNPTPLLFHGLHRPQLLSNDIPQLLIDHGADIDLLVGPTFTSLLSICVRSCPPPAIAWLLNQNPDFLNPNPVGEPALLEVVEELFHSEDPNNIAELVIGRMPDFKSIPRKHQHQLLVLLSKCQPFILNAFHARYGNEMLQWKDDAGKTIFHKMCGRYPIRFESIQTMMDLGADVHQKDEEGNTPFYNLQSFHNVSKSTEKQEIGDLLMSINARLQSQAINEALAPNRSTPGAARSKM